jgi:NADP-dependent aldehyde dehydrogenase
VSVLSRNPETNVARDLGIQESTSEDVAKLSQAAELAVEEYSSRPLSWRAELLRTIADQLDADGPRLVALAREETALSVQRLENELRRTSFQFRFFADVVLDGSFLMASIDHARASPMGPLSDLRRARTPLGPVGVFGSSNFPFAFSVPGGDSASALAAGCPILIKAHPAHPATSHAAFQALERAAQLQSAPEGLLALLFGFRAGEALVDAPAVSAVGFTGSLAAGQALWRRANARDRPIPFYGELGAANPLVVTNAAAAERAVEIAKGLAGSVTLGAGQFCTKPGLLFVPADGNGDVLVSELSAALRQVPEMTMLSSEIADHFRTGTRALADHEAGRTILSDDDRGDANVRAALFEVTADAYLRSPRTVLRDECFGPAAIMIRYRTVAELHQALEATDPALTFSVFFAENDPDVARLMQDAPSKASRIIANEYPTGVGVSWSMQHGGPWPSTTVSWATSVGASAIERWLRPVTYQNCPDALLPDALRDTNPLQIPQRVDGIMHLGTELGVRG